MASVHEGVETMSDLARNFVMAASAMFSIMEATCFDG